MIKKIAFFECMQRNIEFFSEHLKEYELKFFEENLGEKHLEEIADCQIISVANYSPVTRQIIQPLENTKLITCRSTGFDNIDVKACQQKGILVSNTPGYGDDTVAEFTFTLMLMLLRHAHQAFTRARNNNFSWEGLRGNTLKGKTLGIIGTGKIGLKVIKIAKGFGMDILAYSRREKPELAAELGFTYAPLAEVLSKSQIISLHIPSTKDTYHFINQNNIRMFKPGSFLINTSRGEVIDTKALIWALDEGIIQKAALDVLEEERIMQENKLLMQPNVIPEQLEKFSLNQHLLHREDVLITPHIGFNTEEAFQNMLEINLLNITSFIQGDPTNIVNR